MTGKVIRERVNGYEEKAQTNQLDSKGMKDMPDSSVVFKGLYNHALFKSNLSKGNLQFIQNFSIALDTVISMIERSTTAFLE